MSHLVGLGDSNFRLAIYIENRPPLDEYQNLMSLRPMQSGEISHIAQSTGNHWRKIFNVYAKLIDQLWPSAYNSWQDYRDHKLLQAGSQLALLFSKPDISVAGRIHVIAGKGYAAKLGYDIEKLSQPVVEGGKDFGVSVDQSLIVIPYLDYRQLSNAKIDLLVELIGQLTPSGQ
ncbi:hypothetical protein R50073_23690 [Maricurvus nonylphenolicus]|uniref:DUF6942 family protein n=1 Tax=Maricurvus nonylphenolicus TaxID=1008307 RepID=UPI0036F24D13